MSPNLWSNRCEFCGMHFRAPYRYTPPPLDDEEAWKELEGDHRPQCPWIYYRGKVPKTIPLRLI